MNAIRSNGKTLEKVKLFGLTTWDPQSNAHEPFDWAIFEQCTNLSSLEINKATTGRFGFAGRETGLLTNVNFQMIPFSKIEEFFVRGVALDLESVRIVYQYMPNFRSGGLSMIGEEGIAAAAELAWQLHEHRNLPEVDNHHGLSDNTVEVLFNLLVFATTLTAIIVSTHLRSG